LALVDDPEVPRKALDDAPDSLPELVTPLACEAWGVDRVEHNGTV
jgi:hypothetical protein